MSLRDYLFYEEPGIRLYCGDALEILPELRARCTSYCIEECDGRCDSPYVVVTDPPYGIAYQALRAGTDALQGDTSSEAQRVLIGALRRLRTAVAHFVFCDWRSLCNVLYAFRLAEVEPKAAIVWDKGSGVQNLDRYAKSHELILYAGPFGGEPTVGRDVWRFARDFSIAHPTPKPVPLIRQCIETSGGELVIDPFAGSGSTLQAAKELGRRAIGIEIEPKYCEIAVKRLRQEVLPL